MNTRPLRTDCHVHLIGNGIRGSGCHLSLFGTARFFSGYMCKRFGIDRGVLQRDLEVEYAERLSQYVTESSLDAVFLLASDHVRDEKGNVLEKFDRLVVPNDCVFGAARSYPQLLPAVSIHPARPDAVDELARCYEQGSRLVKLLPNYHNVDCSDRRYIPFWNAMAERKMAFLSHTGGELSLPNVNKAFQNPTYLRLPLECGVTVVAAHCGSSSLPWERDYMDVLFEMFPAFPNLFGDTSAFASPTRTHAVKRLLGSNYLDRVIHGSDLPIPVTALWMALRGLIPFRRSREIDQIANPLERDVVLKRELGFPESSVTKLSELLGYRVPVGAAETPAS